MSRKNVMEIVNRPCDCEENRVFFERRNPGYVVDMVRCSHNPVTGVWGISVAMHRRE
jgi:hypothetical protein